MKRSPEYILLLWHSPQFFWRCGNCTNMAQSTSMKGYISNWRWRHWSWQLLLPNKEERNQYIAHIYEKQVLFFYKKNSSRVVEICFTLQTFKRPNRQREKFQQRTVRIFRVVTKFREMIIISSLFSVGCMKHVVHTMRYAIFNVYIYA